MGEAYDGKWRVKCGEWRWAMEYLGYQFGFLLLEVVDVVWDEMVAVVEGTYSWMD